MRSLGTWAMILVLGLLLTAAQGCRERSGRLRLVFSADTRGVLADCGCGTPSCDLARRAGKLRELRQDGGTPILLVDGGNLHGPELDDSSRRTALELSRLLGLMWYDVMVLGPEDARLPHEERNQIQRNTNTRWLGGAWNEARTKLGVDTAFVAERGGLVVGLLDHQDPAAAPGRVDPAKLNERVVERARRLRPWCDVLVVVAGLGPQDPAELAHRLQGLADLLLVTGAVGSWEQARLVGDVRVAGVGSHGCYLGQLDVDVQEGRLLRADWSLLPLDSTVREDPSVAESLRNLLDREEAIERGRLEALRQQTLSRLGIAPDSLPGENSPTRYSGQAACRECHLAQWQAWQGSSHARTWSLLQRDKATADVTRTRRAVTGWLEKGGWLNHRETGELSSVQCEACHGRGSSHVFTRGGSFKSMNEDPATICAVCHEAPPAVDPHSLAPLAP